MILLLPCHYIYPDYRVCGKKFHQPISVSDTGTSKVQVSIGFGPWTFLNQTPKLAGGTFCRKHGNGVFV